MQKRTELRARPRLLVNERAAQCEKPLEVDTGEPPSKWAGAVEEPLEGRLYHGPNRKRIARGDEVDRRAKETHADRIAIGDERREVVGPKVFEPAPERDVRVLGDLGLHSDKPLDRIRGRDLRSPEKKLTLEEGPI